MEESIVERVLILMKHYELTASEFADKIDVQRSSMSHLVSGRNKPSLDFIQKILNNFSDLNPTWLIMGTGPMKQLDLFDIKGEVAPIQPIPAESFRVESPVEARYTDTQYEKEDHKLTLPDSKKVVYTPSAPKLTIIPKSAEPLLKEIPREQSIQAPPTIVAPVVNYTPPDLPIVQQAVAATDSEQTAKPPKANHEVSQQVEKSVQNDKKVVKIVFFYSDNTFETFNPQ